MIETSAPSRLPRDWQDWVDENVQRGCSRDSILQGLLGGGFDPNVCAHAVDGAIGQYRAPLHAALAQPAGEIDPVRPAPPVDVNRVSLDESRVAPDANPVSLDRTRVPLDAKPIRIVATLDQPRVIVYDHLLDAAECDALIALAEARMATSTVVDDATGNAQPHLHRSSSGAWFRCAETGLLSTIEQRIASLLEWPATHAEGLQVMRYGVGGEYRAHFDHFDPDKAASRQHLAVGGQRVATLIMYLSDVASGGATRFESAGFEVRPQRGTAVYFGNVDAAGRIDPATLHAGLPVISGVKYIATKWLRRHARG